MARRPAFRLTAKNKDTREVTELMVFWPPRDNGPEGVYGATLSRDVTGEEVGAILASTGKDGDYFLDLRENKPPPSREGSEGSDW